MLAHPLRPVTARTAKLATLAALALAASRALICLAAAPPAGAFVYWANLNGSRAVGRANLDGSGGKQSFIPDTPNHSPCGVAVDASHVYWATYSFFNPSFTLDTTIGRANLNGSGANQIFITGAYGPCGVAVDSGHIYWANVVTGTIGRSNLAGSGIQQAFITGAYAPCGVAVDSGHVYWANSGWGPGDITGTTIGRANLDGSGVNQSFITGAHGPSGVAVDSKHIYWANYAFPPSSIGRANIDGSGADQSFIAAANPDGVAVDALQPPVTKLGSTEVYVAKRIAKFKFSSTQPGSSFSCSLDGKLFKPCTSPKTYRHLKKGKHTFRVKARNDSLRAVDLTPVKRRFRI